MGAIGVALTLGSKKTGLLLAILMLPLWVPIIILGSGCVVAAFQGLPYVMEISLLAAIWIVCLMFAPLAMAFAFRETV
jgi:heme exporter protein B